MDGVGLKSFFCVQSGTELQLKQTHWYYYQVQRCMAIISKTWCDFVVWTLKGIHVERIDADPEHWRSVKTKLHEFYFKAVLPELAVPRHKRSESRSSRTRAHHSNSNYSVKYHNNSS